MLLPGKNDLISGLIDIRFRTEQHLAYEVVVGITRKLT